MLKKRLGIEAIEKEGLWEVSVISLYFKIPSPLIIPEGCKKIGDWTFEYCDRLEKVIIPKSVERIGVKAFWKCRNATVILGKPRSEFKEIEEDAFFWCDVRVEEKDVKEEAGN